MYTGTLPVKVDKSFISDDCEVIDGENYCYVLYVTAVNGAMYRLPNTGGSGFAYIPIVLCILGAVLYSHFTSSVFISLSEIIFSSFLILSLPLHK